MTLKILDKPLSKRQIKAQAKLDPHGYVSGVVRVRLSDVIDRDLESFLDLLGDKLVGSALLMDIRYEIVGGKGDEVFLRVTGDPTAL